MTLPQYLLIVLALLLIGSGAWALVHVYSPRQTDEIILRVLPGETARGIANKLHEAGIISGVNSFLILARLQGVDRDLKAGTYTFGGKENLLNTVQRLRIGSSVSVNVTLPEGLSLYKTLLKIEKSGLISYDSLYAVATDPIVVKRLTGFDAPSLEGFLYPETYRFDLGMSAERILSIQTEEFFARCKAAGIDPSSDEDFYEKLKLASIVENESMYIDERPDVAGVYHNRLNRGMKLEACPTVDYILEKDGIKREILLFSDLEIDSPYNTYMYPGLPPTPICNPSISSIQAVYQPSQHNYLFFQADREGRNVFSVTFGEHRRKMANLPRRFN